VLTDDKVKFGFDKAQLSDEARAALDEFATQLKTQNKSVYVEIQGHTDNIGGEDYNQQLGEQRRQSVPRQAGIRSSAWRRSPTRERAGGRQ
jgi:outer membrane protein OmpA-like peptidoglycan-associated protein